METTLEPTTLTVLDDALFDIQRVARRPGYRKRLLAALDAPVELSTVRVLRAVERAGDEAPSVGDIAERLTIDPSTASRFVDQQIDAGYLLRHRCTADGRRSRLSLSDTGRALLVEVTAARRRILAEVTAGWDTADLDQLGELLAQLRNDFDHLESQS
ncbi:MAG: MarR family transcriptional regulator [Intrasporangiaceae bacterium]|nr:MarR family transcriptional regulator [Intrasporangiaceae bacterium]